MVRNTRLAEGDCGLRARDEIRKLQIFQDFTDMAQQVRLLHEKVSSPLPVEFARHSNRGDSHEVYCEASCQPIAKAHGQLQVDRPPFSSEARLPFGRQPCRMDASTMPYWYSNNGTTSYKAHGNFSAVQ